VSEDETTKSTKFTEEERDESPGTPTFVVFVSFVVKDPAITEVRTEAAWHPILTMEPRRPVF
jgi:hypothetical protein